MVSLRCKHILTREIATGADIPVSGLISTFPSILGYIHKVSCQQRVLKNNNNKNSNNNNEALTLENNNIPKSPRFLDTQQESYYSAGPRLSQTQSSCESGGESFMRNAPKRRVRQSLGPQQDDGLVTGLLL
jgi:hypothetical protein